MPQRVVGVGGDAPATEERRVQTGFGPRTVQSAGIELLRGDVESAAPSVAADRATQGGLLHIDGGIEAKGRLDLRLQVELGHGQDRGGWRGSTEELDLTRTRILCYSRVSFKMAWELRGTLTRALSGSKPSRLLLTSMARNLNFDSVRASTNVLT